MNLISGPITQILVHLIKRFVNNSLRELHCASHCEFLGEFHGAFHREFVASFICFILNFIRNLSIRVSLWTLLFPQRESAKNHMKITRKSKRQRWSSGRDFKSPDLKWISFAFDWSREHRIRFSAISLSIFLQQNCLFLITLQPFSHHIPPFPSLPTTSHHSYQASPSGSP